MQHVVCTSVTSSTNRPDLRNTFISSHTNCRRQREVIACFSPRENGSPDAQNFYIIELCHFKHVSNKQHLTPFSFSLSCVPLSKFQLSRECPWGTVPHLKTMWCRKSLHGSFPQGNNFSQDNCSDLYIQVHSHEKTYASRRFWSLKGFPLSAHH